MSFDLTTDPGATMGVRSPAMDYVAHANLHARNSAARDFYAQAGMEAGLRESHQRLDEWLETIHNQTRRRQ